MRFSSLYFAILLIGLPFLISHILKQKPATIHHPDLIKKLKGNLPSQKLKVRIPLFLRILAIILLILALMRPQMGYKADTSNRFGIDIMVALDISSSMKAEDFKPNRIEAAKKVLGRFIISRPADRIGLVVFAGKSYAQCPLTTDHNALLDYLDQIYIGLAEDGTAIGTALANCVNRLKDSKAQSKVVLLLTDGENNAGEIDPETAAKLAQAIAVKIYAVGIGNPAGAPLQVTDPYGRKVYARNPDGSLFLTKMNEEGLKQISSISKGSYFIASDIGKLNKVFDQINQLEKTEFNIKDLFVFEERFYWFALPALFLLLLGFLYSRLYLRKFP